jgi:hypothetical protein
MAFNEYQAAHGHGSGWSWDMAKRHSKMKDLIAAQGADWDDELALARLAASGEGPERAFDPHYRLKAVKTPCTEQIRAQLSQKFKIWNAERVLKGERPLHQGQDRAKVGSGEAGEVVSTLRVVMAQVMGRGRVGARQGSSAVISGRDYIEQAMVLCMNRGGRQMALELDQNADAVRVVYEFKDGTQLIVTSDGCF